MLCLWKIVEALKKNIGNASKWEKNPTMVVMVDNLPNHLCLMAVDNRWMATNEWEVLKLQLKKHVKEWQTKT